MGSKRSAGKRKPAKVSVSKLSNKRLNKLAKQGKLKKKLPQAKYVQLLKNRTGQKKQAHDAAPEKVIEEEPDIPLEEADYEYFAKKGRDYNFLTAIPDETHKKTRKKKPKEDDSLEVHYQQTSNVQPTQERVALLPIKTNEGVVQRSMEVEDEDESGDDEEIVEEEREPLPDLSPAEIFFERQKKLAHVKRKVASLACGIVENPEESMGKLKELRLMLDEQDADICVTTRKLVSLSLMEVFKDIIPSYNIRVTTDKEKQQTAKKDTKKLRDFEEGLLHNYKRYLEFLESMCRGKSAKAQNRSEGAKNGLRLPADAREGLKHTALRCLCELLETHPHFNFRTNIIAIIIPFISEKDQEISNKVCDQIRRIFRADREGEVTLEIVRVIGRIIKAKHFNVEPKVLNTFLSLKIREVDRGDGKEETSTETKAARREKFRNMSRRERKQSKQMRELEKELDTAAVSDNRKRKLKLHTAIMKLVFLTYFRVLKQATDSVLLSPVLEGLAKFAHLISIDFFDDLFNVLNELVVSDELSYRDSLHCVKTAFTILTGQGDVFNIDPLTFYKHLYKTLYHLHAGNTSEDVSIATECLQIMINKRRRQISLQRVLSFIKRLTSLCLQLHHNGALSVLSSVRSLIQTDGRSNVLFDTELCGSGVYIAHLDDPEHANASNTALYELHTLRHHYHPVVRQYSQHILVGAPSTGAGQLPAELSRRSALEFFDEFNPSMMIFKPEIPEKSGNKKQKRFPKELTTEFLKEKIQNIEETMNEEELDEIDFTGDLICEKKIKRKRKAENKASMPKKKKKLQMNDIC